jgi:hypothetical protein
MVVQTIDIRPQPGFQEEFLSSPADIVIGGGSAGAGKTFALLLESSRHRDVSDYGAVIFRRTFPEITQEGGLWDETFKLFPYFGARPNMTKMFWDFPSGARVSFKHLQHESDLLNYQGGQFALICFDEITHFTKKMFLYMLSRNRSTCGVRPYIRATCNPDPDSFVAELIEWWIEQNPDAPMYVDAEGRLRGFGYPIYERCGVLRYFVVDGDSYVWGDNPEEVIAKCPHIFNTPKLAGIDARDLVKSITFIPGSIHDNEKLLSENPAYLANLLSQDEDTKNRLYYGNWKVRLDNMMLFEYPKISDIFTNIIWNPVKFPNRNDPSQRHFITIDHARFGRDLCVITAWIGWRAVEIHVLSKSDTNDILRVIRELRLKYKPIPASNIICDQDGIGVIDALNCIQFFGASSPYPENNKNNSENITNDPKEKLKSSGKRLETRYENRKTQYYFHLAGVVNSGSIHVNLENIYVDGRLAKTIKINGKTYDIKSLIRDDLRVVKRANPDADVKKIKITSKEEMKNANGGRSQDFGDNFMLRSHFDLAPTIKYAKNA